MYAHIETETDMYEHTLTKFQVKLEQLSLAHVCHSYVCIDIYIFLYIVPFNLIRIKLRTFDLAFLWAVL